MSVLERINAAWPSDEWKLVGESTYRLDLPRGDALIAAQIGPIALVTTTKTSGVGPTFEDAFEKLHSNAVAAAGPFLRAAAGRDMVERRDDMGNGKLRLVLDGDGDVSVALVLPGHGFLDVEFCTPGIGGGKSPRTWKALRDLFAAMVADEGGRVEPLMMIDSTMSPEAYEAFRQWWPVASKCSHNELDGDGNPRRCRACGLMIAMSTEPEWVNGAKYGFPGQEFLVAMGDVSGLEAMARQRDDAMGQVLEEKL